MADTSLELIAHFDGTLTRDQAARRSARGIGWILRWTAALATLFVAAVFLAQFSYCLAAERALSRAARAGALEATLPRATHQSVARAVARHLDGRRTGGLQLTLQHNGVPVAGVIRACGGDQLAVALALPTLDVLPRWLRGVSFSQTQSHVAARSERRMPGRELGGR
jgi:hypothetical protein